DRAGWYADEVASGRQRDSSGFDGGVSRGRGSPGDSSLQIPGALFFGHFGESAALPNDEHSEWWSACRQLGGLPGIHGDAGGRAKILGRVEMGRGSVPRAEDGAEKARLFDSGGR